MKKNYRIFAFVLASLAGCTSQPPATEFITSQSGLSEVQQLTATQLPVTQTEPTPVDGFIKQTAIQLPLNYPCPENNCPKTLAAIRYEYFFSSMGIKIISEQYGKNTSDQPHTLFVLIDKKIQATAKNWFRSEYVIKWTASTVSEIFSQMKSHLWSTSCQLVESSVVPRNRSLPASYQIFFAETPEKNMAPCATPNGEYIVIAFDSTQKVYYEIAQWDWCAPGSCTDFTKIEIVK